MFLNYWEVHFCSRALIYFYSTVSPFLPFTRSYETSLVILFRSSFVLLLLNVPGQLSIDSPHSPFPPITISFHAGGAGLSFLSSFPGPSCPSCY